MSKWINKQEPQIGDSQISNCSYHELIIIEIDSKTGLTMELHLI